MISKTVNHTISILHQEVSSAYIWQKAGCIFKKPLKEPQASGEKQYPGNSESENVTEYCVLRNDKQTSQRFPSHVLGKHTRFRRI